MKQYLIVTNQANTSTEYCGINQHLAQAVPYIVALILRTHG